MAIDTSMYANALAAPKSVQDYDNERMTAQGNALSLQLGRQKADEYTRGIADQNNLRQVVGQFGGDKTANYNALLRAGRLTEAGAYQKGNVELADKQAETAKRMADTGKTDLESVGIASQQHKDALGNISDPGQAAQWVAAAYNDPRLAAISQHGGTLEQAIARIPQDPAGFAQWKMQSSLGADKLIEYTRANANTQATNATSLAVGAANNATTQRGQNMTAGTAAAGLAQGERHFVATQASGKIPSGYRANPDGSMAFIPGGPADPNASKENAQKKSDAKDVLGLLDEADVLMPKATAGYIGAGVDQIARLAGSSLPGADAAAQLKTIQGALISKMPKMSGPQSDKDVLLYREMAGQVGDSTIPVSQRQSAANMVRKLNEKYAGVPEGSSKKAPTPAGSFSDAAKEARYQAFKAGQK